MPASGNDQGADEVMQKLFGPMINEAKAERMAGLTEGRMVHYVLPDGPSAGQHRPAVVVRVWDSGFVNLLVFRDGYNDVEEPTANIVLWVTSVEYNEHGIGRTWHWIEKA